MIRFDITFQIKTIPEVFFFAILIKQTIQSISSTSVMST